VGREGAGGWEQGFKNFNQIFALLVKLFCGSPFLLDAGQLSRVDGPSNFLSS
jgi:hypothetical protein